MQSELMANDEKQVEIDLGVDEVNDSETMELTDDMDYDRDCEIVGDSNSTKKSWLDIKDSVKSLRQKLWSVSSQRVPNSFVFHHNLLDGVPAFKIFFISNPPDSKDTRVFSIVVPDANPKLPHSVKTNLKPTKLDVPVLFPWNPVLSYSEATRTLSKEEQLLYERKRKKPSGINWFDFNPSTKRFLFSSGPQLFHATDTDSSGSNSLPINELPPACGARINSEMCPLNSNLIAYVCNGNLWVINSATNQERQLTFVHKGVGDLSRDPISAGFPSYIIQEEFDRYKGFWWQPKSAETTEGVYRLLYEVVDESKVNIVRLFSPTDGEPEVYRFPVPGSFNATSELRLLELQLDNNNEIQFTELPMKFPIQEFFEWAEYLVRVGWTPDGLHIWAQLLDRKQTRLELFLFPIASMSNTDSPPFYVIYSEVTNIWINVTELLIFLPCTEPNRVQFIWASEETGFRHLYLVESELRPCIQNDGFNSPGPPSRTFAYHLSPNVLKKVALTAGEWEVVDVATLAISHEKRLIFFHGLCDSPIERHIYAVSYGAPSDNANQIKRLTHLGNSYNATFSEDCTLVVLTYSSTTSPPICRLFRVTGVDMSTVNLEPVTTFLDPMVRDPAFACPEISSHQVQNGPDIYAMIYRPIIFDPSKKYPTILNVYGGPHVQMVHNAFRGTEQYWIHLLASQGYCIINIDSRGSFHRGLQFEAHLKNRMGTVELEDQVEVLHQLSNRHSFIDTSRVGIFGWSYGGYLSLFGLVQFPSVFKVAVAGAPVCSWNLYDTGYTERYMDLPSTNKEGYELGSVLNHIQQFPDESDRLLIFQGLLDENVHFFHTAKLVSALISAGKPHQLQIYPTERHSLRTSEASEHFEATLLSFLQRCL